MWLPFCPKNCGLYSGALSITLDDNGYEQPTGYKYDKAGRQTCVADPGDYGLEAGDYDPSGNFHVLNANGYAKLDVDIESELSNTSKTTYEGTRRKSVTDDNGNETSFEYDDLGRVKTTKHPTISYVDEDTGNTLTDHLYTHVSYDGLGRKEWQSQQTSADGDTVSVPDSDKRWFEYDVAGRLVEAKLPIPEDGGTNHPIYKYYYDSYGNQMGILDPLGRLTIFTYNELNQQVDKFKPFIPQPAMSFLPTDKSLETDGIEYIKAIDFVDMRNQIKYEHRAYDSLNRLETIKDYLGQITLFTYDDFGRMEYKYYYESGNYPTTCTEYTQYEYDNLGRKKFTTKYNSDGSIILRQTENQYDNKGRLIQVVSPEGMIHYGYNSITGRKEVTWTDQTETIYTYDGLGRLQSATVTKRDGEDMPQQDWETTEYDYTQAGSRQGMLLPNDAYPEYTYNPMNRLTNLINFETKPVEGQDPPPVLSSFHYHHYADGMRASVDEILEVEGNSVNRTITYSYDYLNRLLIEDAIETNEGDGGIHGYNAEYTYDLAGNRLTRDVAITFDPDVGDSQVKYVYTQYEYEDDTDQLDWEQQSTNENFTMRIPFGRENFYAYADGGGIGYKTASGETISTFKAFMIGLPTKWNRDILIAAWALLSAVVLLPVLIQILARLRRHEPQNRRLRFNLFTRCLCLLLAFTFILGPNEFNTLAQADVLYENLDRSTWSQVSEQGPTLITIDYDYDDNGSLIRKTTYEGVIHPDNLTEERKYVYNLQNRLAAIIDTDGTWEAPEDDTTLVEYVYNDAGIKVQKIENPGLATEETTYYLVDAYNHTGYAQVLEEETWDTQDANPENHVPLTLTTYTLGDDVIGQAKATWNTTNWLSDNDPKFLLYDGHGSTRQLSNSAAVITESYSYDAYGMMLGGNPTAGSSPTTNLLYSGEHFDTNSQNYYLRARYYDPSNGRFNRLDPYSGNSSDPQSLHKYLYCHANPVNCIDPSGNMSIGEAVIVSAITSIAMAIITPAIGPLIEEAAWYLIPAKYRNILENIAEKLPDAFLIGGSFNAGTKMFGAIPISGNISLEALISPWNGKGAAFLSGSLGTTFGGGLHFGFSGFAGLVWANNSAEYRGSFITGSITLRAVPRKIRDKILDTLYNIASAAVFSDFASMTNNMPDWKGTPEKIKKLIAEKNQAVDSIMANPQSSIGLFSFKGWSNGAFSIGLSKGVNVGNAGSKVRVGVGWSRELWPRESNGTSFR